MTKSVVSQEVIAPIPTREPRPFLFLEAPRSVGTSGVAVDAVAVQLLADFAAPSVSLYVRSLVNFTIALQNRRALEHGDVQPIQVSVLNRRRRAARAWFNAILAGKVDAGTRHAVANQWLPMLCGTGPEIARCAKPAASIVEFVRGAITASLFAEPANNLVANARAMYALEQVLSVHLAAVREAARGAAAVRG